MKVQNVDVLLVTVTGVEARAILNLFPKPQLQHIGDQTYHDLGSIRGARIFMVQSEMGSGGPSGATLTIEEGIRLLNPSAVIMVGIAFGISEGKQNIGDILVSKQLIPYDLQRVGRNRKNEYEIFLRDDRPSASHRMLQRFRAVANYWQTPPTVEFGSLLSGAKLIDNQDFRDQMLRFAPEAIGGEMEGSGLYAAAHRKKVDWIIVKAICDWADGNKHQDKKQRQQRAAENAARFTVSVLQQGGFERSEQEIAEMPQSSSAEQHLTNLKGRYQTWLSKITADFHIPGPSGVSLPIEAAWTELNVLNKEDATKCGYNAKDVAEIGDRVVITGGPGAGKSTLCRKLAHDLTDLEEIVLRIDLPSLANRIQSGINITTALVDIALNGFDAPFEERETLLADADCLIADGLDECGNLVVAVAETLQRWSTAHPFTRIVLTSRPIGYETVYFPEWAHYALMPLTQNQVQSSSQKLIQALASDTTSVEKQVSQFQERLKDNHIASLAARNPLLLGFLIQLSLQREALARQRADLYEQILNLWRVSLPQGRIWQISQLDALLAWRSLELIGWLLLLSEKGQKAYSHDQLVQQMSQQLVQEMDIRLLQASATASNSLQFWHERGVLDRVQIGDQAIYTFVHATFNEYAAGRYLARLSPSEIQQWVRSKYHDTHWREPILLAAGCGRVEVIARTLLDIDAEDEQATSVLLFAAATLGESPIVPDALTRLVIDRLIARLTSTNPILAYEVAEQGVGLVKKVPGLFVPLLQPLFAHHQIWTRLAAIDLALASGSERIEIEILEQLLKDIMREPISSFRPMKEERGGKFDAKSLRELLLDSNDGWGVQNDVIVHGAQVIARMRPDTSTKELLQALCLSSAISATTKGKLSHMLIDLGCQEFVEQHQVISEKDIRDWLNKGIRADEKMLETILRLTHFSDFQPKKRRKLLALRTLIYALNVPEAAITQWDVLHRLDDATAIAAVLQGFIQLYKINTRELALDTMWALERIQKGLQNENASVSLLQLLPRIPMELHVPEEINITVPTQELFRALKHPSAIIAYGAGCLLVVAGGRRAELEDLLQKMKVEINSNEQMKGILGRIVPYIWENDVPLWLSNLLKGNQIVE